MKNNMFFLRNSSNLSIISFCEEDDDDVETPTDDEGCPELPDYADVPD